MKILLEQTEIFTVIDGVTVRVWNGVTEDGAQCFAFVARLAFHKDEESPLGDLIETEQPAFFKGLLRMTQ